MTSEEHLGFIHFLEKGRMTAKSDHSKEIWSKIKAEYINHHTKNTVLVDSEFKLLKDIGVTKAGTIYQCFGGLVSSVNFDDVKKRIPFTNTEYFTAVNMKYSIKSLDKPHIRFPS